MKRITSLILSIIITSVIINAQNVKWTEPIKNSLHYGYDRTGIQVNNELMVWVTLNNIELYDASFKKVAKAPFRNNKDKIHLINVFTTGSEIAIITSKKVDKLWVLSLKKYNLQLKQIGKETILGKSKSEFYENNVLVSHSKEKDIAYIIFKTTIKASKSSSLNIIKLQNNLNEVNSIKEDFAKTKYENLKIRSLKVDKNGNASFLLSTNFTSKEKEQLKKQGKALSIVNHFYLYNIGINSDEPNKLDFNDIQSEICTDKKEEFQDIDLLINPQTNNVLIVGLVTSKKLIKAIPSAASVGHVLIEISQEDLHIIKHNYIPYTVQAINASRGRIGKPGKAPPVAIYTTRLKFCEFTKAGKLYVVIEQYQERVHKQQSNNSSGPTEYSYTSGMVLCTSFNQQLEMEWSTPVRKFLASWNDGGLHVSSSFILDGETLRFTHILDKKRMAASIAQNKEHQEEENDSLSIDFEMSDEGDEGSSKKKKGKKMILTNRRATLSNCGLMLTSIGADGSLRHQVLEELVTHKQMPITNRVFVFGDKMVIPAHSSQSSFAVTTGAYYTTGIQMIKNLNPETANTFSIGCIKLKTENSQE